MEELEVSFCDLCNASVPDGALKDGAAVRHADKLIGPCCLAVLRPPTVAVAMSTSRKKAVASGAGVGLLTVGLILLAATVAGAMFLDWRLGEEVGAVNSRVVEMQRRVEQQADGLGQIRSRLAETTTGAELKSIEPRFDDLQAALVELRQGLRDSSRDAASRATSAGDELRILRDAQAQVTARLALMQDGMNSLDRDLASLLAAPRPREPIASLPEPMPAPDPMEGESSEDEQVDLPSELQAHVARLSDADDTVRFVAVDELLAADDDRVYPILFPLASDPDTFVRRVVLEGLGQYRTPESVDLLIEGLADPEGIVRHTAYESLRKLTGHDIAFGPDASRDQRSASQKRWRQWWEKSRAEFMRPDER